MKKLKSGKMIEHTSAEFDKCTQSEQPPFLPGKMIEQQKVSLFYWAQAAFIQKAYSNV